MAGFHEILGICFERESSIVAGTKEFPQYAGEVDEAFANWQTDVEWSFFVVVDMNMTNVVTYAPYYLEGRVRGRLVRHG